jgi:hypothetical protein
MRFTADANAAATYLPFDRNLSRVGDIVKGTAPESWHKSFDPHGKHREPSMERAMVACARPHETPEKRNETTTATPVPRPNLCRCIGEC